MSTSGSASSSAPAFPFSFFVGGSPVSANVTGFRRAAWKDRVRNRAQIYLGPNTRPTLDEVVFSIGHYYDDGVSIDADNAIKVAQDALNRLVYHDDVQVTDSLGYKRDLTAFLAFTYFDPRLLLYLRLGNPFVHIQVSLRSNPHFQRL